MLQNGVFRPALSSNESRHERNEVLLRPGCATQGFHWINVLSVIGLIGVGVAIMKAGALGIRNPGNIVVKTVHGWVG